MIYPLHLIERKTSILSSSLENLGLKYTSPQFAYKNTGFLDKIFTGEHKPHGCTLLISSSAISWLKQNSKCDKTQQIKLWQNSRTQIMSKTQIWTKLKDLNCDTTKYQKLHVWENSKTETVTKLKKTPIVTKPKLSVNSYTQILRKLKTSNYNQTQELKL